MTNEIKMYVERELDVINYLNKMVKADKNSEPFNEYSTRLVTSLLMLKGLVEIFGLELVEEDGNYIVK